MKPGDLVRVKGFNDHSIGVILGLRTSSTDFHDATRSRPWVYANIMWGRVPIGFQSLNTDNGIFELSIDMLEIVK